VAAKVTMAASGAAAEKKKGRVVLTKNAKKRLKKKEKRAAAEAGGNDGDSSAGTNGAAASTSGGRPEDGVEPVTIEYVSAAPDASAAAAMFAEVFSKFATAEVLTSDRPEEAADGDGAAGAAAPGAEAAGAPEAEERELSKKQRKAMSRMTVAELKQMVGHPEVVEAHDVTAGDPKLLVYLKSYRSTVPVPRHWCHKRRYLQGKRGVEKKPWQLPEFIAQTGIEKIRKAVEESNAAKNVAAKSRDRVQPKMGRMDVDYQVLHDAFFKWQTKPPLSGHGELYYEGKEFEVSLKEKRPGTLSASLKAALGMPDGAPPPWLINMQRYGPPPSYPTLRIQGLNAPIPEGASFGYHPGGWGKPPVDEYGRPLYGDVFGAAARAAGLEPRYEGLVGGHWGELGEAEDDEDEFSADEGFEMVEGTGRPVRSRAQRRADEADPSETSGIETPLDDGISSAISGLETPDAIDLRKRAGLDTPDSSGVSSAASDPKPLYTVIDEEKARARGGANTLFASDRRYKVAGVGAGVDVEMDPEDASSQALLRQKYDAARSGGGDDDDVGGVLSEGVRAQKRKLDKAQDRASKKQRDFKF